MTGLFEAEIREQPEALARVLRQSAGPAAKLAAAIRRADPAAIVIAARGSSNHAAIHARYLFETRNGIPVSIAAPSVYTQYHSPPGLARVFVLGISQSGRAADVAEVVELARGRSAGTAALTNDPDSELAAAAENVLPLNAGPELSVPASKTYTATLAALDLVSAALDGDRVFEAGLHALPGAVARVLELEPELAGLARLLTGERALIVGRGFHLASALEIALKLTEVAGIAAAGLGAADLLHGPIAAVHSGLPVLLLEEGGPVHRGLRDLALSLGERGSSIARLTTLADTAAPRTVLPGAPHPALTPITFAVAGQILALHAARVRGVDPDGAFGLSKVTVTV